MPIPSEINVVSRISSIELTEFKIEDNLGDIDVKSVAFDNTINYRWFKEKKSLVINIKTQFYNNKSMTVKLGHISCRGEYEIVNFDEIFETFSGQLPNNLPIPFITAQIATVRGLLIASTKGTKLEGVILPMLNIQALFQTPPNQDKGSNS